MAIYCVVVDNCSVSAIVQDYGDARVIGRRLQYLLMDVAIYKWQVGARPSFKGPHWQKLEV